MHGHWIDPTSSLDREVAGRAEVRPRLELLELGGQLLPDVVERHLAERQAPGRIGGLHRLDDRPHRTGGIAGLLAVEAPELLARLPDEAGVVEHGIDATEVSRCLVHHRSGGSAVGDVEATHQGVTGTAFGEGPERIDVTIGGDDPAAPVEDLLAHRPSEAARGPGHEPHPASSVASRTSVVVHRPLLVSASSSVSLRSYPDCLRRQPSGWPTTSSTRPSWPSPTPSPTCPSTSGSSTRTPSCWWHRLLRPRRPDRRSASRRSPGSLSSTPEPRAAERASPAGSPPPARRE